MEDRPIQQSIRDNLDRRINALNRESEFSPLEPQSSNINDKSISAMLTKTCWARVVSAVVDKDPETGKPTGPGNLFRLSTAFNSDGKGGYSPLNRPLTSQQSLFASNADATFRPHNGITSISTDFVSHTTQNVSIEWVLWDINQFEEYRNAFLKHSRIVTVEFGWASPDILPGKVDIGTIDGMTQLYRKEQENILKLGGDYYVTTGKIVNFNYSVGQNGEYRCTTELRSMGNDMFANKIYDDPETAPVKVPDISDAGSNQLADIMKQANNTFSSYIKTLDSQLAAAHKLGKQGVYHDGTMGYCSWGYFEDIILNTYFGYTTKSGKNISSTGNLFDSQLMMYIRSREYLYTVGADDLTEIDTLCRYNSDIASHNLHIILPGNTIKLADENSKSFVGMEEESLAKYKILRDKLKGIDTAFKDYPFKSPTGENGVIRNMVFSTDFLKQTWGSGISSVESGLNSFWNTVSSQYGGFWEFEARSDNFDTSRISIYDKYKLGAPKLPDKEDPTVYKFSVYGRKSIMKNFNLSVEMSSAMATMATFHSNKQKGTSSSGPGPDEVALQAMVGVDNVNYNRADEIDTSDKILDGLSFPFLEQKIVDRNTPDDGYTLVDFKDASKALMANPAAATKNVNAVTKELELLKAGEALAEESEGKYYWYNNVGGEIGDTVVYDQEGNMLEIFTKTMNGKINNTMIDPKTNKSYIDPIVPVKISFTIPGIGGLKPFDLFKVDYLPKRYRDNAFFQIMKTSHKLGLGGWETSVDAIMRVNMTNVAEKEPIKETSIGDTSRWLEQVNELEKTKPGDTSKEEGEDETTWWDPFDGKIFG